ncbi:TetR family transcriptional regulator [Tabrizicola sp.]|uniref:TetR family transcriptional regulator n=1 Tax=Tabrizicola sp. TaxID=2005166 RepID=UPI00286CBAA7|nr:TetR family transcriptional regulator [Tabrizicola sp.]
MPRTKTIPDATIFSAIRQLLAEGGEKAVSFSTVANSTGLAAPTLVQRYGSRDGMVKAALLAAWDAIDAATDAAIAATADKGPQALLKALDVGAKPLDGRDEELRLRAARWRAAVESSLSLRVGSGEKGRETASLLFAVWQGQQLWAAAGGRGFRLKDAIKRLT